MCETAKAAEDKAKEYRDDEDEARYDSAQDACETLLDTWKEADGCRQFGDEDNDDNWDEENTESDQPTDGGAGSGASSPVGEDASLNCEAECIFNVACYDAEPSACTEACLQTYAEELACVTDPRPMHGECVIVASATCDEDAYDACIVGYPNAMTLQLRFHSYWADIAATCVVSLANG